MPESRTGLLRRGLITATLKECSTYPVTKDILIISSKEVLTNGETSLSSLVGMEFKRQVDGLDKKSKLIQEGQFREKQSKYLAGYIAL